MGSDFSAVWSFYRIVGEDTLMWKMGLSFVAFMFVTAWFEGRPKESTEHTEGEYAEAELTPPEELK